jgi:hypothetical protein
MSEEITATPESEPEKEEKPKKSGSGRSVETLFRNIYRVHVEVSAMADNKANLLISVNSIILILATAHAQDVVTHPLLLLPAAIIVGSCLGSMVYAVLVARPRVTRDKGSGNEVVTNANLLFFGGFSGLSRESYIESLTAMASDPETIHPAMAADLYDLGIVLKRKFKRLQTAYGFLLYGMPGGITLFLVMQTILRLMD